MVVAKLSALRTGSLFSPTDKPDANLCQRLSRSQAHSVTGRVKTMQNPMTPTGTEPATFHNRLIHQLNHQLSLTGNFLYFVSQVLIQLPQLLLWLKNLSCWYSLNKQKEVITILPEIQLQLTFQNVNTIIFTLKVYKATSHFVY